MVAFFLCAIPSPALVAGNVYFRSPSYGYSLTLPGGWTRIPVADVRNAWERALPDDLRAICEWVAAFQQEDEARVFVYPYVIVQAHPYAKLGMDDTVSRTQFSQIVRRATGIDVFAVAEEGVSEESPAIAEGWAVTQAQVNKQDMLYSMRLEGHVTNAGTVAISLVGRAGHKALIQVAFYDRKSAWSQSRIERQLILDSFTFDREFAYQTNRPGRQGAPTGSQSGQSENPPTTENRSVRPPIRSPTQPGDRSEEPDAVRLSNKGDATSRPSDPNRVPQEGSALASRVKQLLGDYWQLKLVLLGSVGVVLAGGVLAGIARRARSASPSQGEWKPSRSGRPSERIEPESVYLSLRGRINRKTYWFATVSLFIWYIIAEMMLDSSDDVMASLGSMFAVAGMWPTLAVQVKRWHDRNKSGLWYLLTFVPFIGPLWALIELGFLKGTPGANRYGLVPGTAHRYISEPCDADEHSAIQLPASLADLVAMFAKIAKADGVVSKGEIELIDEFFLQILRLTPEARRQAIAVFNQAKSTSIPYEVYVKHFHECFEDKQGLLEMVLDFLVALALADGELSAEEVILLSQTAGVFGIEHPAYEQHREERQQTDVGTDDKSRREYYAEILGLTGQRDFNVHDVKRVYKHLAVQYHPDKVAHLGPKLREVAEKEMKKINEAYAFFREAYGF